jgi:multidrug efflux pump
VDGSINIYSQIGLITLIGLITKHGILIVEFANQIRREKPSISKIEAVSQATLLRLRPILMTTAAMVLGAIPLVFASGAGAESRRQIGWVIFGGMIIGTLFTLFVIPAIYTYLVRPLRKELE